jgi:hypothetical protein
MRKVVMLGNGRRRLVHRRWSAVMSLATTGLWYAPAYWLMYTHAVPAVGT